jgi:hypothetical protein
VAALIVSLLTGLRIAADAADEPTFSRALGLIALTGSVYWLHYLAGVMLAAVATGYGVYLALGQLAGRFALPTGTIRLMLTWDGRSAWRVRNVLIYYTIFALIACQMVGGSMLYLGVVPPLGVAWLIRFHQYTAYALVLVAVLHVASQYAFGAAKPASGVGRLAAGLFWLLKMLRPKFAHRATPGSIQLSTNAAAMVLAIAATVATGGGLLAIDRSLLSTLTIERIDPQVAPILDGVDDDPVWARARRLRVHTRRGINLPRGASMVEIQAVATAETVFFKCRWEDPTRSLKHLLLIKRADGWHLLHQQFDLEDENLYYEDKFGLLFSRSSEIAGGGTVHLGPKPIPGLPDGLSRRSLHYTIDDAIVDFWHWRSVRSQPTGHADDNYFGPLVEPTPEQVAGEARYKGGFVFDPGKAGYKYNFRRQGPGGYRGPLQPIYLPIDLEALQSRLKPIVSAPNVSDSAAWFMNEGETAPYDPAIDARIPVGTIIPSITLNASGWEGDRADLSSGARWVDRHWTLEIARKLDTGSSFDVAITTDAPIYLWVSVFDHTQTRHSKHIRPVKLVLAPLPTS